MTGFTESLADLHRNARAKQHIGAREQSGSATLHRVETRVKDFGDAASNESEITQRWKRSRKVATVTFPTTPSLGARRVQQNCRISQPLQLRFERAGSPVFMPMREHRGSASPAFTRSQ
jgi:hypothetical protein